MLWRRVSLEYCLRRYTNFSHSIVLGKQNKLDLNWSDRVFRDRAIKISDVAKCTRWTISSTAQFYGNRISWAKIGQIGYFATERSFGLRWRAAVCLFARESVLIARLYCVEWVCLINPRVVQR